MKAKKCFVCGGEVDLSKHHIGSIGADGMVGQRHTRDSGLCKANVDHALNTTANMAYTLGLLLEQYSINSPVFHALRDAKAQLDKTSKKVLHYL